MFTAGIIKPARPLQVLSQSGSFITPSGCQWFPWAGRKSREERGSCHSLGFSANTATLLQDALGASRVPAVLRSTMLGLTPWRTYMEGSGCQKAVESTVTFHCQSSQICRRHLGGHGTVERVAPKMKSFSRTCTAAWVGSSRKNLLKFRWCSTAPEFPA